VERVGRIDVTGGSEVQLDCRGQVREMVRALRGLHPDSGKSIELKVGNSGNTGERLDAGPAECCRGVEGLRDGVLDSGEGAGGGGASG
jgi:hypothetical protein